MFYMEIERLQTISPIHHDRNGSASLLPLGHSLSYNLKGDIRFFSNGLFFIFISLYIGCYLWYSSNRMSHLKSVMGSN